MCFLWKSDIGIFLLEVTKTPKHVQNVPSMWEPKYKSLWIRKTKSSSKWTWCLISMKLHINLKIWVMKTFPITIKGKQLITSSIASSTFARIFSSKKLVRLIVSLSVIWIKLWVRKRKWIQSFNNMMKIKKRVRDSVVQKFSRWIYYATILFNAVIYDWFKDFCWQWLTALMIESVQLIVK